MIVLFHLHNVGGTNKDRISGRALFGNDRASVGCFHAATGFSSFFRGLLELRVSFDVYGWAQYVAWAVVLTGLSASSGA